MQTMMNKGQYGLLAGVSLLVIIWAAGHSSGPSIPVVGQIMPSDAFALIRAGTTLVLDVREKDAYDKGHLPGAVSVPIGQIDNRMGEFEAHKAEEIIVYCNDGSKRGPVATDKMNKAGYPGARNLDGGIEGWRRANYQTISK